MKNLRKKLIYLGHINPEMRKHLRPILDQISSKVGISTRKIKARPQSHAIRSVSKTFISQIIKNLKEEPSYFERGKKLIEFVPRRILTGNLTALEEEGILPEISLNSPWSLANLEIKASTKIRGYYYSSNVHTIFIKLPEAGKNWERNLETSLKSTLLHEFIHAFDHTRAGGEAFENSGVSVDTIPSKGDKDYYLSPLELNAYLQEAMALYEEVLLDALDIRKENPREYLGKTTREEVLRVYNRYLDPQLVQQVSTHEQKKILKRLYSEIETVKENLRIFYES